MEIWQPAYIGVGSNLEGPRAQVLAALRCLGDLPRSRLVLTSRLYASRPFGPVAQPDFVNAVAKLETELTPRELLEELLTAEARFGRERPSPGAPRTLDLDLLLYGDRTIEEPGLVVPHPRMHERAFVLMPLAEIASDAAVPRRGSVKTLLAACRNQKIRKMDP